MPIVHCMGGVGRTGTSFAAFALERAKQLGVLTQQNVLKLIEKSILRGRIERGPEFLQTATQLETLWKLALLK